jgi:hypothetical protein
MPLATILDPPRDAPGFFVWATAHADHHYGCVSAASVKLTRQFDNYVLDPFDPEDMANWLNSHQQMHLEMNTALNINGGYALDTLNWDDPDDVNLWFAQNYAEHQAWAQKLGVG